MRLRAGAPDKTEQARIIITTDGECDDQNSLRHILLYANDFDIAGIVYSASKFHFQGDGEGTTLREAVGTWTCEAEMNGLAEDAGALTEFRPQEMGWVEDVIENEYGKDYKYLVQNDPNYPSPDYLLSVTKVGNVEFEGDVREESEGSELIVQCILDDDPRPLYIQSWGGFNTVARALLSIAEDYQDTDQWDEIYNKVCDKVIIQGHGQDTTWEDYISALYPDLLTWTAQTSSYGYFSAQTAPENVRHMFQADWLTENVKFNHGKLMENYHLMGDGAYYYGEPDFYQYGQITYVDWSLAGIPNFPRFEFEQYDWLAEGDSGLWIPLIPVGLRGLENQNYGTWGGRISLSRGVEANSDPSDPLGGGKSTPANREGTYDEYDYVTGTVGTFSGARFLQQLQEDWAARCDWAVNTYENCNHAPVVGAKVLDLYAAPGQVVTLEGTAEDPDGDSLRTEWWVYEEASEYSGNYTGLMVWDNDELNTKFTVPQDAVPGDYINIVLEVKDDAAAPFTRYAQVIVHVVTEGFEDVAEDSSYAEAVETVVNAGVMNGTGSGKFQPDTVVTRSQAVTALARMAMAQTTATDAFTDVKAGSWYGGYVGWAVEKGIVQGDGKGHFMPDNAVTGEQLELMLERLAEVMRKEYTPVSASNQPLTRAEMAVMLANYLA